LDAEEASRVLGVSEGNQRVLLHRARSRLRGAMENLLAPPRQTRAPSKA
jgi:RNA polymerase sigma-70 factor (ECF subfamily)